MKIFCYSCRKFKNEKWFKSYDDSGRMKQICDKCSRAPVYLPKSKRLERNKECSCGSGKKYKKCCYGQ